MLTHCVILLLTPNQQNKLILPFPLQSKIIPMSKKEKISDKAIEELIESYKGQNEALEKILEKIIPDNEFQDNNNEEND